MASIQMISRVSHLRAVAKVFALFLLITPLGSCDFYDALTGPRWIRQLIPTNFEVSDPTYLRAVGCRLAVFPVLSFSDIPPYVSRNGLEYVALPSGMNIDDIADDNRGWQFAAQTPGTAKYCARSDNRPDIEEKYLSVVRSNMTLFYWVEGYEVLIAFDPEESILYLAGR